MFTFVLEANVRHVQQLCTGQPDLAAPALSDTGWTGRSPAWGWSFHVCRHTEGCAGPRAVQSIQFYPAAGTLQWAVTSWAEQAPLGLQLDWMVLAAFSSLNERVFHCSWKISSVEFLACEWGSERFAHSSLCPAKVSLSFPCREAAWLPGYVLLFFQELHLTAHCCPLPLSWTLVEWSKHWA